jgi:NADPH:quinone reductase-like Zn-dependent oxidoreductase
LAFERPGITQVERIGASTIRAARARPDGGLATSPLQLAKAHGAHVTGVDSPGRLGMRRTLGADDVIDRTQTDFTRSHVLYDLIFDIPGNHPVSACRRVLEPDGTYVLIGRPDPGIVPRATALHT